MSARHRHVGGIVNMANMQTKAYKGGRLALYVRCGLIGPRYGDDFERRAAAYRAAAVVYCTGMYGGIDKLPRYQVIETQI